MPATDPNAAEVFYRINTSRGTGTPPTVNALMRRLRAQQLPTLLLWGEQDPWITSSRADRLQRLYPEVPPGREAATVGPLAVASTHSMHASVGALRYRRPPAKPDGIPLPPTPACAQAKRVSLAAG